MEMLRSPWTFTSDDLFDLNGLLSSEHPSRKADEIANVIELDLVGEIILDQFENPVADSAGGVAALVSEMRIVPVDRAAGEAFAFEQRDETDPIDVLRWIEGLSSQFEQRGIPIRRGN